MAVAIVAMAAGGATVTEFDVPAATTGVFFSSVIVGILSQALISSRAIVAIAMVAITAGASVVSFNASAAVSSSILFIAGMTTLLVRILSWALHSSSVVARR